MAEELGGDFRADFVTAAADGGADGGEQVAGLGFALHLHLAEGFDDDAGEGAAPAGMDGSYSALFRVDKEDGDAVGSLDGEEESGVVGEGGIALADFLRGSVEKMDDVGVDLFQGDESEVRGA